MEDLVGKKLGEYEIIEHIGHGAVADVYKALQPKLNRHVAVKVLSPAFASEAGFRERFVREAQAIAKLDHPNILPVYDFDQQEELVYIVMQYVDTGTLDDLMGQPMDLNLVLRFLEQMGGALAHAHSRGIVHRDIKPSNILLGPDNWVLLTDFGLVKMMETPSDLTPSGMSLGTPAYMAPEQVTGDPVDPRADVYSLGATVYQMVTGRVPYGGDSGMAVAFKHVSEPLIPPRMLKPNLPSAVDQAIIKALAKDRDLRYQTIDEFVNAFRRAVGKVAPSKPPEATMIAARPKKEPVAAPSGPAKYPSTLPPPSGAPTPLEAIWPPEPEARPSRRGSLLGLLGAVAGTLAVSVLVYWGVAVAISALLE